MRPLENLKNLANQIS